MDKKYRKEDGSMDIERIDNLSLEEYIEVLEGFTIAETSEYFDCASKIPIDENQEPVRMIYVDYDLDDERNGVEAHSFINELRAGNNRRDKTK